MKTIRRMWHLAWAQYHNEKFIEACRDAAEGRCIHHHARLTTHLRALQVLRKKLDKRPCR